MSLAWGEWMKESLKKVRSNLQEAGGGIPTNWFPLSSMASLGLLSLTLQGYQH